MSEFNWKRGGAVFASGYVKQWMDLRVQALLKTPKVAGTLKEQPIVRAGVKASLNAGRAYVEQKVPGDSALTVFLKMVAMDTLGELNSQIGREHPDE